MPGITALCNCHHCPSKKTTAIRGKSVAELRPFTYKAHLTPASIHKNKQEHKNREGEDAVGTQMAPKLIHVHAGSSCST